MATEIDYSSTAQIYVVQKDAALGEYKPMTEMSVPGQPIVSGAVTRAFVSFGAEYSVGIWEGTPGVVRIDKYPVHKCWNLLSGKVTFVPDGGAAQTFTAGDVFVIPKGFSGSVTLHSKLRKQFVSFASRL